MSRFLAIPEPLRLRQARASNPATSAWVSANAGSGKTHVLTQRVLRLLLDGTAPAQILCLAYTKAAAANMAERVFGKLALWTSLDDKALAQAIVDCGASTPGAPDLVFARQLFARAIETPGGLKIQTLHAFAERLLRLFPFEANVPAHFKVLDETESKRQLTQARDAALAELGASSESRTLSIWWRARSGAARFDELLTEALRCAEIFEAHDDAKSYAAALRVPLGLSPGAKVASVEAEMLGGDTGRMRRERWAERLEGRQEERLQYRREPSRSELRRSAAGSRPGPARRVFQGQRRGGPSRRRERRHRDQGPGPERPVSRRGSAPRAGALACPAREKARRAHARAQRRAVRRRPVDPRRLRADEGRARRARFQRPDRARACAGDALQRRVGDAQARLWARPPADRRSAGRLRAAMGHSRRHERRVFRRRRRAAQGPHNLRGRRREAVDLRLPGRGAGCSRK